MIANSSGRLSRIALFLFAAAASWILGVRAPRATSFATIGLAGSGRAALTIEERGGEGTTESGTMEVFSRLTFASQLSSFKRGLYIRTTFIVPRTGETAVLTVDLDRSGDRERWLAGDSALKARAYIVAGQEGVPRRLDATPAAGELMLDNLAIGSNVAGFRVTGGLEMVDARSAASWNIDLMLESTPTPEQGAQEPSPDPRTPTGGVCASPWCWTDDTYYDDSYYGYGCDSGAEYETTSDGCESDPMDDGSTDGVIDGGSGGDPGTVPEPVSTDGACSGESTGSDTSSSGCDDSSSPDDSSGSTSGCEDTSTSDGSSGCGDGSSSSDASACGGSSDSSGCGSGCEGDTLAQPRTREAGVEIVGGMLFLAALGAWVASIRGRRY